MNHLAIEIVLAFIAVVGWLAYFVNRKYYRSETYRLHSRIEGLESNLVFTDEENQELRESRSVWFWMAMLYVILFWLAITKDYWLPRLRAFLSRRLS